jgi:osmoprotectant transport system permease protein
MAASCLVGLPLGILAHRFRRLRTAIPAGSQTSCRRFRASRSSAILIAPLGYLGHACASRCGSRHPRHRRGAGFIALFLYSLLPVVANTATG